MANELILTSLQQSLSAASGIPLDIKFLFRKETNDGTAVQEIRAHKVILALVSDVFEKAFYGGLKDDGSIEIEDATKESFEAMINFIYTKETDVSVYGFEMLCSIYYLAEKYNINALKEEILEAINTKDISVDNVLNVGVLADKHSAHEELSETLFVAATQSLEKIFDGQLNKAINFFTEINADSSPALCRSAVKMMAKLKTTPSAAVCSNCKATTPCMNGVGISGTNLVLGAKVSAINEGSIDIDKILYLHPNIANRFVGMKKDGQVITCSLNPNYYVYNCIGK